MGAFGLKSGNLLKISYLQTNCLAGENPPQGTRNADSQTTSKSQIPELGEPWSVPRGQIGGFYASLLLRSARKCPDLPSGEKIPRWGSSENPEDRA